MTRFIQTTLFIYRFIKMNHTHKLFHWSLALPKLFLNLHFLKVFLIIKKSFDIFLLSSGLCLKSEPAVKISFTAHSHRAVAHFLLRVAMLPFYITICSADDLRLQYAFISLLSVEPKLILNTFLLTI